MSRFAPSADLPNIRYWEPRELFAKLSTPEDTATLRRYIRTLTSTLRDVISESLYAVRENIYKHTNAFKGKRPFMGAEAIARHIHEYHIAMMHPRTLAPCVSKSDRLYANDVALCKGPPFELVLLCANAT